jgi:hypothetical protein
MSENNSIPRKFTVVVDEKPVEILMSYGVLNQLMGNFTTSNPDEPVTPVEVAMLDSNVRAKVLAIVFSRHGEYGLADGFNPMNNDIEPDELQKLFEWVAMHVSDFFLRTGETAKRLMEKNQARLNSLTPSPSGSKD